jgi:hypothetical protein
MSARLDSNVNVLQKCHPLSADANSNKQLASTAEAGCRYDIDRHESTGVNKACHFSPPGQQLSPPNSFDHFARHPADDRRTRENRDANGQGALSQSSSSIALSSAAAHPLQQQQQTGERSRLAVHGCMMLR